MMNRFFSCALLVPSLAINSFESARQSDHATQPASQPSASQPQRRIIKPFTDVTVILDEQDASVEIRAWTCLDSGFVEQIACAPQTREHESLMVIKAKPSQVHAALLMAGFESGAPGKWIYEDEKIQTVDPTGEKLALTVRFTDPAQPDKIIEQRVRKWLRGAHHDPAQAKPFPEEPWVFGGSNMLKNPAHMGEGEHYVADLSGSIVGLVTFGDEVVGFSKVISDQESVESPVWEVNTEVVPPQGTEVVLILRKWQSESK